MCIPNCATIDSKYRNMYDEIQGYIVHSYMYKESSMIIPHYAKPIQNICKQSGSVERQQIIFDWQ